jgi:Uma2 family endonuclease
MATKVFVPVEEFLRMSFDGPEPEYKDGEVIERAMPTSSHSETQQGLAEFFYEQRKAQPIFGRPELRVKLRDGRYVTPDYAVFAGAKPTEDWPSSPPHIVIEILSPDDKMTEVRDKLEEYRVWGAPYVWLIDPKNRHFYVLSGKGLSEVESFEVAELGIALHPDDILH